MKNIKEIVKLVETELLVQLNMESVDEDDPIEVYHYPLGWELIGAGNYAAVFSPSSFPEIVVKIYAQGRPGFEKEVEIYRQLGEHPSYSQCYHAGENYLILKRLYGTTLYQCVIQGLFIPPHVIQEVDDALNYAKQKGLFPHDVHGKNVMMSRERKGLVVDISDFYKEEYCSKWDDLKEAYFRFYLPFFSRCCVPISPWLMNGLRKGYKKYKKIKKFFGFNHHNSFS